jgi:ketosteroid isomerase-like protein
MLSTATHALGRFRRRCVDHNEPFIEPRGEDAMKPTKLAIVLIAALAMLGSVTARANSAEDQKTVAALDDQYQAAVKNNDTDTMARILADDFVVVWGTGQSHSRAELLNDARNRSIQYEHNEDSDKTVGVWGDTAVVTAKLWVKGVDKGKPFEWHVWFSDTYVRTLSGWRYVHGMASLPLEFLPSSAKTAQ